MDRREVLQGVGAATIAVVGARLKADEGPAPAPIAEIDYLRNHPLAYAYAPWNRLDVP